MDDVIVTKTASGVVVGVMNEYGYMMGGGEHCYLLELSVTRGHPVVCVDATGPMADPSDVGGARRALAAPLGFSRRRSAAAANAKCN